MRGDFVLYKAKKWNPVDWVVARATGGPYVHVEIDLGDGTFIGEHGRGLIVHPQDITDPVAFVTPKSTVENGLALGMEFVQLCIDEEKKNPRSHGYGWFDIASDALKLMGSTVILGRPSSGDWDCSHFVTLYLIAAHAADPLGVLVKHPEVISPNDLARAYGVL